MPCTSLVFIEDLIMGRRVTGYGNFRESISYVEIEDLVITWQEVGIEDVAIVC